MYFELDQYEQAIEAWICAYNAGYSREQIVDNIYQCFIFPNDSEFRNNYEQNNDGFTQLLYDDCTLDFVPVSEETFYIFDKEEVKFQGKISLGKTVLQEERVEFSSILYTDTWDIREIILDLKKRDYGTIYLLLDELEPKFVSFFKLPFFKELYMKKIVIFHDTFSIEKFLAKNLNVYLPKQVITLDESKYKIMIQKILAKKRKPVDDFGGKNILFLKGESQYGALRRIIDHMASAFRGAGYNTLILDATQADFEQQLSIAKGRYEFDAVITCNAILINLDAIRKLGKKYCALMCDHPIWHAGRILAADKDTILWYGDRNNVSYVKKYYPNVGRVDFCIGGADCFEEDIAYLDRKFDLVLMGGYSNPETIYEKICCTYSGRILELVKDFIKKLITFPDKTYEGAFWETLQDYGQEDIEDEEFNELAEEFPLVDKYVRAYFRDKIIRQIVQNDLVIHVTGNGWDDFESEYKDHIIIENNDWYTARKMIANAKISLNVMPWFKGGLHDRILTSLLSGAVLLTDSNEYIEEEFQDMENTALYHLEHVEEVPEKIKFLLSHQEIAEKIAKNGCELARQRYTWEIGVKQMVEILKEELNDHTEFSGKGHVLSIAMEGAQRQAVAKAVLEELLEIEQILDSFQSGATSELIRAKDYQYCVSRLKDATLRLISDFPNVEVGVYVWSNIVNLCDPIPTYAPELIRMQIGYLVKAIAWGCLR